MFVIWLLLLWSSFSWLSEDENIGHIWDTAAVLAVNLDDVWSRKRSTGRWLRRWKEGYNGCQWIGGHNLLTHRGVYVCPIFLERYNQSVQWRVFVLHCSCHAEKHRVRILKAYINTRHICDEITDADQRLFFFFLFTGHTHMDTHTCMHTHKSIAESDLNLSTFNLWFLQRKCVSMKWLSPMTMEAPHIDILLPTSPLTAIQLENQYERRESHAMLSLYSNQIDCTSVVMAAGLEQCGRNKRCSDASLTDPDKLSFDLEKWST